MAVAHPLHIDLHCQTQLFLAKVPSKAAVISSAQSTSDLLQVLSNALSDPSLTLVVENLYRPILFDLCARWITHPLLTEDQLVAICLLLEVHEELFPVLYHLVARSTLKDGPLAGCPDHPSDRRRVNRLLLAYYRILQANRELPSQLLWQLTHLSTIIWDPVFDNGSRLLAIRCYALQSGMGEAERVKIEQEVIGAICDIDCPVFYEDKLDGTAVDVDGWILPVIEARRIQQSRVELATSAANYFSDVASISSSDLCSFVADIEGVLLLRSSDVASESSPLIRTIATQQNLRVLAHHLSLRVPLLLTSPPSSGKGILLTHLALQLFPQVPNQIITVHLADTSLDPRSLIGSYVSSTSQAGTFEWKEGVLVRAMRQGKWIVFKDIDRGSPEVLGVLKPLVESYGATKWIGGCACLDVSGRGRIVAHQSFAIFATRSVLPSRNGVFASPLFLGAHKFSEVVVLSPTSDDLHTVISAKFPRLGNSPTRALIHLWEGVKSLGSSSSMRTVGIRELEKFCTRVDALLPSSFQFDENTTGLAPALPIIFPNTHFREQIFLEARDVFFGAAALTAAAQTYIASVINAIAEHLGLESERTEWLLSRWSPDLKVEKDVNDIVIGVRSGNTLLRARPSKHGISTPSTRPFAMHKPAVLLLSRIITAVSLGEPVLLTGETGTGKTSVVTHLSGLLRKPLVSLNLSHQTESSDLLGGFKPVDARVPASALQQRFLDLFGSTFSRRKNEKFETEVRKAVSDGKWKRAVGLWKESARLARDRLRAKAGEPSVEVVQDREVQTPRKRRKVEIDSSASEIKWNAFEHDVGEFEVHHVLGKSKFAFDFVEGPLVKAVRNGEWVLLDEINLASSETLECISSLLQSPTSSITLTEQGSLEPVPRHPDFRLFACMNPATDVGKKDLTPNIRCRFTEIDVPAPDTDRDTLVSIVAQYIGQVAVGDKAAILNVAEFYVAVKQLSESRTIADGSNHRPHYSMRTLSRALTFAADTASMFGLRRALWEGCLMAFTMVLDGQSADAVTALAQKHLLAGVRNPRSLLAKEPPPPASEGFVKFGSFYLEQGPLPVDSADHYILTPSVEAKLIDLARIILTRRFPVLIEGPTSSGKTSSVEYLAKKTGHRFVRINNHEHTDIQEYLGSYVADPITGKLVFQDGLLVRALRNGDWIVLDELNLAPTDVLEALNRLLDDNRELVIPETQEVLKPHPHFMIFATQNPPGLYAGRKILSRAFRNRFLEVHFEDVPEAELETILCERCSIAPSYGKKIVTVFRELQNRRQSGRVFESKFGFATLRDLFRWAGRDAMSYQELADNGYMLLAERARRLDDKIVVKEVIEKVMGVHIDEAALYSLENPSKDMESFLGCPPPKGHPVIWTSAMQRLFILLSRALRFKEPVLLVGETGCGKTSVCQVFAAANGQNLHTLNCHQGTETADLIGGLRPIRNRSSLEADIIRDASTFLQQIGRLPELVSLDSLTVELNNLHQAASPYSEVEILCRRIGRLNAIFEWHNGPLVEAMEGGDLFLLDEISLADDSVLERLNSVLEPSRTMVLAEKGGDHANDATIIAADAFKLVATMNPGGDYGKKELSPALRNRFTEIWVPSVDNRVDLELIVSHTWQREELKRYTSPILDFVDWLCGVVGDRSLMNLRDVLAWVDFFNRVSANGQSIPGDIIFHHGAHMTYIDGFASMPQLSGHSKEAIVQLKGDAERKLQDLVPASGNIHAQRSILDPSTFLQLGSFAILKGQYAPLGVNFNFNAPTTKDNATRVIRACQLPKPLLLEGSPGVGKTSLVTALAAAAGHLLCRINLSDQTDLADLFGSDLPVEGGSPGEFAWKNAEFLNALVEGHWVLLDEMNLAPQAVLEGLNSVLDHRGTVFIPELGRSFTRHLSFRIFAAQNPLNQGSGRKGLPKSFLNRFTKVYVDELTAADLHLVCQHLFPDVDGEILERMVSFNTTLNEEITTRRTFGREGSPWEFNLRDVIRWGSCLSLSKPLDPTTSLRAVYLHRFRNLDDRSRARALYEIVFNTSAFYVVVNPIPTISSDLCHIGLFSSHRHNLSSFSRTGRILKMQLTALEAVGTCINHSWLAIITGGRNSGKSEVIRLMADLTGNELHELSLSSSTEATDILGSFEQVDLDARAMTIVGNVLRIAHLHQRTRDGCHSHVEGLAALREVFAARSFSSDHKRVLQNVSNILEELDRHYGPEAASIRLDMQHLSDASPAQFEWFDGPLVRAMKHGHWLVLDGANLCNPSVLDRLNSVCEMNGTLTLNERGHVDGNVVVVKPHPNFRLFMTVDPQYGELSRAMRNRGIEVALNPAFVADDSQIVSDFLRLPPFKDTNSVAFDGVRRGLSAPTSFLESLPLVSSGFSLRQDSSLSYLMDRLPILLGKQKDTPSLDALLHVTGRSLVPAFNAQLVRFLKHLAVSNLDPILSFLRVFPGPGEGAIHKMRVRHSMIREVPLASILVQPMMFYEHGEASRQDVKDAQTIVLRILDLSTMLTLDQSRVVTPLDLSSAPELHRTTRDDIVSLHSKTREASIGILNAFPTERDSGIVIYDLVMRVMRYTHELLAAVSKAHFDYSSVYAIVNWLLLALTECPSDLLSVFHSSKKLSDTISLSSGKGLSQIWSQFLRMPSEKTTAEVINLNSVMQSADASTDVRRRAFTSMALRLTGKCEFEVIDKVIQEIQEHIVPRHSEEPVLKNVDRMILLAEMGILTSTSRKATALKTFLEVVCDQSDVPLLRMVPYQDLLWRLEAGETAQNILIPVVMRQQLRWMKDLWTVDSSSTTNGAALLLHATNLKDLISTCNLSNAPMSTHAEHRERLKRNVSLTLLQCESETSRVQQLVSMLSQSSNMVSQAFQESQHDGNADHSLYAEANERFLRPALLTLQQPTLSRRQTLSAIGHAWITFARMVLHLVIPDIPIDPAAIRNCEYHFAEAQSSFLAEQIGLHQQLDGLTAGNASSATTRYLERQRDGFLATASSKPQIVRENISRLHMFWSEIIQFQSMISPAKMDDLLRQLEAGDHSAGAREESVQQTVHNFLQRLATAYAEFDDLGVIFQFALYHLRMGLRILRQAGAEENASMERFAGALTVFPAIKGASAFLDQSSPISPVVDPCQHELICLSSLLLETGAGVDSQEHLRFVGDTYDCIARLWLIDQEKAKQDEAVSQSLYRQNHSAYDDLSDAAREEHEFRALFPSFEDVFEAAQTTDGASTSGRPSLLVSEEQMKRLLDLHYGIVYGSTKADIEANIQHYSATRIRTISGLPLGDLSDAVDEQRMFQLQLVHDSSVGHRTGGRRSSLNFYLDSNINEIQKASKVVDCMRTRLVQLIEEWPDQMVLHHLKERCDAFLSLSLDSPVAKVLSALEQLLLQTEDWELFANRTNNLKPERSALIELIVEWRRMELSCWDTLLESEYVKFQGNGMADWWFRLYNALIRGSLDAFERAQNGQEATSDYMTILLPLLNDFIRTSSIGQFQSRMKLLGSFERYCFSIIPTLSESDRVVIGRVQRLVKATWETFDLYSPAIASYLREQRATLEKEVKNFVKLASWKDINVQALKQSAQRTHHQLYKIIRKFRDTLRLPAADRILPQFAGKEEGADLPFDQLLVQHPPKLAHEFPIKEPTPTSSHLANLDRTYARFSDVLQTKLRIFITSALPRHADDLSSEIILGMKDLSSAQPPADLSSEKRTKWSKALLVRKRKAWSDLLKELKRAGFATNLKSETLQHHQDSRWVREQPALPSVDSRFQALLIKGENYFHRLEEAMNDLRASIPTHHSDLTTRELQRGVVFLESCFGMAIESRARLAVSLEQYTLLRKTTRRLHMLATASEVTIRGPGCLNHALDVRNLLSRVVISLEEATMTLNMLQELHAVPDLETLQHSVNDLKGSLQTAVGHLNVVADNVALTTFPVILSHEYTVIKDALTLVDQAQATIFKLSQGAGPSREIFTGIHKWLVQQTVPSMEDEHSEEYEVDPDTIIETCLITVQSLLAKSSNVVVGDEDDRDNYIRSDYRTVHDMTHSANVGATVQALGILMRSTPSSNGLLRLLPFLDQYENLLEDQFTCHAAWTKALFKLSHVLCSLLQTLSRDGFCKPPDLDESGSGEDATGTTDGLGMGEGTGAQNVSKEIEEESQVEGLQGETDKNEDGDVENDDDNAIEMADDFGGDMKDVPDTGSQDDNASDQESDEEEPDEQVGDLEANDPDAVDEKLWGDEEGPDDSGKDEQTGKDHSEQKTENSEVAAKEGDEKSENKEKQDESQEPKDGEEGEDIPEEQVDDEKDPEASGAPMDAHVPEADTLDLPDDIDLGMGDEPEGDRNEEDAGEDDPEADIPEDAEMQELEDIDDGKVDEGNEGNEESSKADEGKDESMDEGDDAEGDRRAEAMEEEEEPQNPSEEAGIAPPDIGSGDDNMESDEQQHADSGENASGEAQESARSGGGENAQQSAADTNPSGPSEPNPVQDELDASQDVGDSGSGIQQGQQSQTQAPQTKSDPLRSLGDALKEARQMFNEILNNERPADKPTGAGAETADQVEYVRPDEEDQEMQALGPAEDEQTAKLRDLKLLDDDKEPNEETPMDVDMDMPMEAEKQQSALSKENLANPGKEQSQDSIEGAITHQPSRNADATVNPDPSAPQGDVDMDESLPDEEVEVQLRQWQEAGAPTEGADHMWRLYESLTHDLAYALCEQLRLILEPTLATRLKGDYRTGKRLNMKKIIPYIASDYTKDKIWLRRTRPSQREYQILIALDDSRSMSESHSVHLAYQTMALVSKALTRLEAGDIGIAKFGQAVDILHGFSDGPFTDQTGMKVMSSFKFDQKATNVLSLVDRSLQVLEKARETRSMSSSSAADLWQLEVIISDGICQDHEQLRSVLRKAEEQRVMIVFIIIDSLDAQQGSIFTMEKADFQNVDGRMELKLHRYLDSFPFEYYVVLRNVEALPGVLATTLKQFFERISEE